MSEHDPDLCARIARVIGLFTGTADNTRGCVWDGGTWRPFAPDTDPADAWRVLEWVRSQDGNVSFQWCNDVDPPHTAIRQVRLDMPDDLQHCTGPTDMIALCNAVAALGGEDE